MGRFARSWDLFRTSLSVVRQDKELLWMPILSALAAIATVSAIAGVGFMAGIFPDAFTQDGKANPAGILLAFTMYVLLAFVGLFFNAAVIAGATQRLNGGDPTIGSALSAAAKKAGKLFLWAIVVATVNVILQAIRERSGILGRLLASIAGMAWNLATYFMIPILVFEDRGMGDSVRRSGGLFKSTWGETVIGQGGLGIAGFVLTLVALGVGMLALMLLAPMGGIGLALGIAILVVGVLGVVALMSVLDGVYKAALYRYATTKDVAPGFNAAQLGGAFQGR